MQSVRNTRFAYRHDDAHTIHLRAAEAFRPPKTRVRDLKSTTPTQSVAVCCSHKVVAVGFNTLCYDASVGVLNPPHE